MFLRAIKFSSYAFFVCFCLLLLSSCSSTKTIVNGLDEKEANEILVFLSSKGIDAQKLPSGEGGGGGGTKLILWDIKVNSERANEAMAMLNQAGLPRRRSESLLNIFASGGLVPSDLQEQIRYQAGLAAQIASSIRKIDGVLDAEVLISFPKEDPLNPGKTKQKITASVYVKHNGVLDDPNSHLMTKIKRLVAASVTGLDYDDVTVIADRARMSGPMTLTLGSSEEEKQFVNVWSIILAKESLTRFRIVFFSFIILILLLMLTLIWLIWKMIPLLNKYGGIKELFHIHPIPLEPKELESIKEAEVEAASPKEEEGKTDKEIDET